MSYFGRDRDDDYDDPYADAESIEVNPNYDSEGEREMFVTSMDDLEVKEEGAIELNEPVPSLDQKKKASLCEMITLAVPLEMGQQDSCPEYNRQQMVLSELPQYYIDAFSIEDIVFPPVGAEILTKKKIEGLVWNIEGLRASKRVELVAYGAKEIRETYDEAVVFQMKIEGEWRTYLWQGRLVTRIRAVNPVELRCNGSRRINYTNDDQNEYYDPIAMIYTYFRPGKSYYVYIDGIPYYMPSVQYNHLQVKNGRAISKEGTLHFECGWPDGIYLMDMSTKRPVRSVVCRPDSDQQITVNTNSLVTTYYLLKTYPFLAGDPKVIPAPHVVEVVPEIDTRLKTCQVLACEVEELDNRKKVFLSQLSQVTLESMNLTSCHVAVVVGNLRFFPFRGMISKDVGYRGGKHYVRDRTGGEEIVVAGMKPHYLNGTWYRRRRLRPPLCISQQGNSPRIVSSFEEEFGQVPMMPSDQMKALLAQVGDLSLLGKPLIRINPIDAPGGVKDPDKRRDG